MCDIAALAGAIPDEEGLDIFGIKTCESKWAPFFEHRTRSLLIGVNPGGDRLNRRWNPDCFSQTARRLLDTYPARIVLLGCPAEASMAKNMENMIGSEHVVNLSGRTSLHDLCYMIGRFDLLLTNDSGPMHIAAAAGTPVVGIFGPENPVSSPTLCQRGPLPCGLQGSALPAVLQIILRKLDLPFGHKAGRSVPGLSGSASNGKSE